VLRIGVDAREMLGDATGVGRYLAELLRRWTARGDAASRRLVLFANAALTLPLPAAVVEMRVLPAGHGGTWWEQTALRRAVKREPLDVFFAPAYTAPLGLTVPVVLTIHDVSYLAHPEWFRPRERWRRRWLTRRSARAAAAVLTDSAFSRDEIARLVPLDPMRIRVIPPGVTARHRGPRAHDPRRPLVLFVGTLLNRRRVPLLIEAFAAATADLPDARLAIVGTDRTWPPQDFRALAERAGAAARVDLRSYASDDDLAGLYGRASVFVFLSEYEGFGLTPLEALAAGVPIVVLDTPVAREVYGPAATYVPPTATVADTARTIRAALADGIAARQLLSAAPEVLARYSWDDAAERTLEVIEGAARRR
jgi:glycosyltransferase involved in cell wall biosynthesis